MAFSKVERWSRKLDEIEPLITRYHRWATGDIVLIYPDTLNRLAYVVTKIIVQEENHDLCKGI